MGSALAQVDAEAEALALRLRLAPPAPGTAEIEAYQAAVIETVKKIVYSMEPNQIIALCAPASEVLFGGAAGGLKSWYERAEKVLCAVLLPGIQQGFFRRHVGELTEHIEGSNRFPAKIAPMVDAGFAERVFGVIRFKLPGGDFEGGSRIWLRHFSEWRDKEKYKVEMGGVGVDEAGDFDPRMLPWLRGRCRVDGEQLISWGGVGDESVEVLASQIFGIWQAGAIPQRIAAIERAEKAGQDAYADRLRVSLAKVRKFRLPPYCKGLEVGDGGGDLVDLLRRLLIRVAPRVSYTANPGGLAHSWLKTGFIQGHKPLTPWKAATKDGGMVRMFIPSFLQDNPHLDTEAYKASQSGLGSEILVRAMRDGNWDIIAGGFFADCQAPLETGESEPACVIDPLPLIPLGWDIYRGYDDGSSHPWAYIMGAVADGNPVTMADGQVWDSPPRGSIYLHTMSYGMVPGSPNVGTKQGHREITRQLVEFEKNSGYAGRILPGPGDGLFGGKRSGEARVIDIVREEGLDFIEPIKYPGSIAAGLRMVREMMKANYKEDVGDPVLLISKDCVDLLRTIWEATINPSKPNELAAGYEDHAIDVMRYLVMMLKSGAGQARITVESMNRAGGDALARS